MLVLVGIVMTAAVMAITAGLWLARAADAAQSEDDEITQEVLSRCFESGRCVIAIRDKQGNVSFDYQE